MIDPVVFADHTDAALVNVPKVVWSAVDVLRWLDIAIRELDTDPVADVDITTVTPNNVAATLDSVIQAEARANARHGLGVLRLRTALANAATTAIREHAEPIMAAMRAVHDPAAAQLAEDGDSLDALSTPVGLAASDTDAVLRWSENNTAMTMVSGVQTVRADLAEYGYRLRFRDAIGRELEQLTRFADAPVGADRAQLTMLYGLVEQGDWRGVIRTGCRLWLPSLTEQGQRIEALRPALASQATRRAATSTSSITI